MKNKINEMYINNIVNRVINETANERVEKLENMLMGKETEEGNAFTKKLKDTKKGGKFTLNGRTIKDTSNYDEKNEEVQGMCEQCGGGLTEGICEQCSAKYEMEEGIHDVEAGTSFKKNQSFDYVQEEDLDIMDFKGDDSDEMNNKEFCKYQKEKFGEDDKIYQEKCSNISDIAKKPLSKFEMNEKLYGNQKKLDKNKNNRIDSEDFKMLRNVKKNGGETDEMWQAALSGMAEKAATGYIADKLAGTAKQKIKDLFGENRNTKIKLTENEMIDFIEKIVNEQKLKSTGKHKGTATYEKAHKGSGKENDEYIKSVAKKMKEYLNNGTDSDYDTNPKIFPKGNGELSKMKKKAYIPSDAVKDYTDNFTAAALENIDYDEIRPNEEWVKDNIVGSSKTGNNPKWANTGESDVNKKRNEIREKNLLAVVKRKAYNKSPQPVVTDESGDKQTSKLMMKLESTNEKSEIKLNEEFDRMKQLLSYNKKTQ